MGTWLMCMYIHVLSLLESKLSNPVALPISLYLHIFAPPKKKEEIMFDMPNPICFCVRPWANGQLFCMS